MSVKDYLLASYFRKQWKGCSRIWNILKKIGISPYLQVTNKYGAKFYLSPDKYIDSYVIYSGYYESEVLEAILSTLDTGSVLWDIGANFGLHAITAKYLQPQSRVICIEPSPPMGNQIQENCKLNGIEVEVVNIALSDSPQFQSLYLVDGNPGMSTTKPWEKTNYSGTILCWSESGDNLVANHILPQPNIIKVDVEGSELEVFMGMRNILINESLKVIIFEAGINFLSEISNPLYGIITNAGFTVRKLNRHENTHHNLDNFIAVKS